MFNNIKKVSVICAHPDDEVLGCGGTIAKLSNRRSVKINVLFLGNGIAARRRKNIGRWEVENEEVTNQINMLRENTRKALLMLGVVKTEWYDFPDNQYDSVPLLSIVKKVEMCVEANRPDLIMTHHLGDLNIDHEITNRAVVTACRPIADVCPKYIMTFDVLSSTEWFFGNRDTFRPNVFVNIEDEIGTKIKALKCYETEVGDFPFPRSEEAVRAQAMRYGSMAGFQFAEAFELIFSKIK